MDLRGQLIAKHYDWSCRGYGDKHCVAQDGSSFQWRRDNKPVNNTNLENKVLSARKEIKIRDFRSRKKYLLVGKLRK